jgi:hypothetical protein
MARVVPAVQYRVADLDFATWHAHLAARPTQAPLIFVQPRREATRAAQDTRQRMEPLDLAAWRDRLRGVERRAA